MRATSVRSRMLLLVATLGALAVAYNLNPRTGVNVMTIQISDAQTTSNHAAAPNPLLPKWEGEYGGVPPFDRVQVSQFKPALEAGMAENLAEVEKIAKDPAAPTFENTIDALERAGATLDRVTTVYGVFGSTMAGPEFQAGATRDGAQARRFQRSNHSKLSTLQTHRGGLQLLKG